jgi:hypothetical protein
MALRETNSNATPITKNTERAPATLVIEKVNLKLQVDFPTTDVVKCLWGLIAGAHRYTFVKSLDIEK